MDKPRLKELIDSISDLLPNNTSDIKNDFKDNLKILLNDYLRKIDVVTREEFDVQSSVLAKTRKKLDDLEDKLKKINPNHPKIIAFESVYSMDGDFAPVKNIVKIAKKYKALTYVDEVHAVGMYGKRGAGVCEQEGVMNQIDILQGTLAKAFGVMGGYISGNRYLIDFIRSHASGFIFTTSLPPCIAAGAYTAMRHLKFSKNEDSLNKTANLMSSETKYKKREGKRCYY